MTDEQLNEQRKKIAALLKRRRNYLQLTQEQVSEMSGLGIATLKRLESGKFWIGLKQIIILSIIYGIEPYPPFSDQTAIS